MDGKSLLVLLWLLMAIAVIGLWHLPNAWRELRQQRHFTDEILVNGCHVVMGAAILLFCTPLACWIIWDAIR